MQGWETNGAGMYDVKVTKNNKVKINKTKF